MKKIYAILLCAVMVFSLAACSSQNEQSSQGSSSSNNSTEESTPPESSSEPAEQPSEPSEPASSETPSDIPGEEPGEPAEVDGKTLVVYYSATNNTEAIAGYIAEATGGDLFELVPVEPCTSDDLDWTNPDSRVSREHDDESLRNVELTTTTVENWDEYDTVFIGYPIWWGIAACR